jgi:hypothetical protein
MAVGVPRTFPPKCLARRRWCCRDAAGGCSQGAGGGCVGGDDQGRSFDHPAEVAVLPNGLGGVDELLPLGAQEMQSETVRSKPETLGASFAVALWKTFTKPRSRCLVLCQATLGR